MMITATTLARARTPALIAGGTNKSIARNLAISPRTVELYRARLMDRMNVSSLAELLKLANQCTVGQA